TAAVTRGDVVAALLPAAVLEGDCVRRIAHGRDLQGREVGRVAVDEMTGRAAERMPGLAGPDDVAERYLLRRSLRAEQRHENHPAALPSAVGRVVGVRPPRRRRSLPERAVGKEAERRMRVVDPDVLLRLRTA